MSSILFLLRNCIFGISVCLSLAVLGLSAHWAVLTTGFFFAFEGLGIVVGALTAIALSGFVIIGILRKNAIITVIAVELPTVFVLSAAALAEGVITNDEAKVSFPPGCDPFFYNSFGIQLCKEIMGLKGVSFALFALMAVYWLPLLVMVLISLTQGQNILGQSVRELTLSPHVEAQSTEFANGFMGEVGVPVKDPYGGLNYDQDQQLQQQQIQLQELELQQQQAVLQQQYLQQENRQV